MMNFETMWIGTVIGLAVLALIAFLAHLITRYILLRIISKLARNLTRDLGEVMVRHNVFGRIAYLVPLTVVSLGMNAFPQLPDQVTFLIRILTQALSYFVLGWTFSALLNVLNEFYQRRPSSEGKPIKGYLQMVRIVIYFVVGLLIFGTLLNRDVLTLLAGLGAIMAVLLLVFQSTILSLVASVQASSYDMVRVGDWIEMPALNADGYVIDISLHTITVQNWDRTLTFIPTHRLLSDTFKNWRGMFESGGRRIKRSLMIDQTSVRFLTDEERKRLQNFFLLDDYLKQKQIELAEWNRRLEEHGRDPVNSRRLTNLGTFRAYVAQYLDNHQGINHDMISMVRQLQPTAEGIPLELYCFTKSTVWVEHEGVQADIFDHLLAILPEFGLRVFQHPSGADWREAGRP